MVESAVRPLRREVRECDVCLWSEVDKVWENTSEIMGRGGTFRFDSSVVICKSCGFVFNSPCPGEEDLLGYYRDTLSNFTGQPAAYSIERRLESLAPYAGAGRRFLEIGGNESSDFHRALKPLFPETLNCEPNSEVGATLRTISDIPSASADIVAHYDTLEHVRFPLKFLSECNRVLVDGGTLICEVPDLRLYPRSLMLLSPEHVNHFSLTSLTRLAATVGFELVDSSFVASRPFSFLSVFQKSPTARASKPLPLDYLEARACMDGGLLQLARLDHDLERLRNLSLSVLAAGKKVTLWAVTEMLKRFLQQDSSVSARLASGEIIVVDADPRKSRHLEKMGCKVHLPETVLNDLQQSDLIIVFSPRNAKGIQNWLHANAPGQEARVQVPGLGQYGEPLLV
jgi:hypothetical protein